MIRSLIITLVLSLALPVRAQDPAPQTCPVATAPAGVSMPLVLAMPDGSKLAGRFRTETAEVVLAQRVSVAEDQRNQAWNSLADCKAGKLIQTCEGAASKSGIVWWVVGGLVLGGVGGYLASRAVK